MPETISLSETRWSNTEKIAFRFLFVLFLLIIVFANNGAFPFWYYLIRTLDNTLALTIPWIGNNILGISGEISTVPNGSGDTTFNFIINICIIVVAGVACIVWSLLDYRRKNYSTLYYWLTVLVRYYVALMLFNYGMIKIFKLQFPYPDLYRLSEPYGHSTPMGLAWTFFGFSKGYNFFVGIAEISALLLLFRRTMTFGALLALATSLNILAVNLFFDVPVKFASLTLVIMCLFLLSRDFTRLFAFFFLGQATALPKVKSPSFSQRWVRILKHTSKTLLLTYVIGWGTWQLYNEISRDDMPKTRFYGVYEINEYQFIDDSLAIPHHGVFPWKQVVIAATNRTSVRMIDDSSANFSLRIFLPDSTITFVPNDPRFRDNRQTFHYDMSDSSNIVLRGRIQSDSVRFILHKIAGADTAYRLRNTEFHWISDRPNNK